MSEDLERVVAAAGCTRSARRTRRRGTRRSSRATAGVTLITVVVRRGGLSRGHRRRHSGGGALVSRHTVCGCDWVGIGNGLVSGQGQVGGIEALTSRKQGESCRFEVRRGKTRIAKHAVPSSRRDLESHVLAHLPRHGGGHTGREGPSSQHQFAHFCKRTFDPVDEFSCRNRTLLRPGNLK